MPRLSDPRPPVEGIAALRGSPLPAGRHVVRILVQTKPLEAGRDGAIRLGLSIADAARARMVARTVAVGIGDPGAEAVLVAEAALPPGRYRIATEGAPSARALIELPAAPDAPVASLCGHGGRNPSRIVRLGLTSPDGGILGGCLDRFYQRCCRKDFLKARAVWRNRGWLALFRPERPNPARIAIGGKERTVRPGDYLVSSPEWEDSLSPGTAFPLRMRQYYVSPGMLAAFREDLRLPAGKADLGLSPDPRPLDDELARALDAFEASLRRSGSAAGFLGARGLLTHVLCLVLQTHPNRSGPFSAGLREARPADPRLKLAMDYLAAHLAEPYDRLALARAARASDQHLRWLFQTRLGMPPVEYLQALRVERAKTLLADPEKKLQAVAWEVGYKDVRTFRRVFQKFAEKEIRAFRG